MTVFFSILLIHNLLIILGDCFLLSVFGAFPVHSGFVDNRIFGLDSLIVNC